MHPNTERIHEIEARRAALLAEAQNPDTTTERLQEISEEARGLNEELAQLETRNSLAGQLAPHTTPAAPAASEGRGTITSGGVFERRAHEFARSGHMTTPLFDRSGNEHRSLLVSSGKLATPTAVLNEVGALPAGTSGILEDVHVIDATGTGAYEVPYKKTDAKAADHTEGEKYAGTGPTFDKVTISPVDWGVLDSVGNQVSKMTPVAYANEVQVSAVQALYAEAEHKILTALSTSDLLEKRADVAIDANYLRNVVLGFKPVKGKGPCVLYVGREDLAAIGAVRGTSEKKPLYEITFDNEENTAGIIKEGGMASRFRICDDLEAGTQYYGQPRNIKLPIWGDYEIKTDEGGHYFDEGLMGIRANVTAGSALGAWHGMQQIKQAGE